MKLQPLNLIMGVIAIIGGILFLFDKADLGLILVMVVILIEFIRRAINGHRISKNKVKRSNGIKWIKK